MEIMTSTSTTSLILLLFFCIIVCGAGITIARDIKKNKQKTISNRLPNMVKECTSSKNNKNEEDEK